jgi:hypothetical protein
MLSRNLEMYANSAAVATTNVSMLRGDTDSNKPLTNVAERPLPGRSFLFFFSDPPFSFWLEKKNGNLMGVSRNRRRNKAPSVIFWLKGKIGENFQNSIAWLSTIRFSTKVVSLSLSPS